MTLARINRERARDGKPHAVKYPYADKKRWGWTEFVTNRHGVEVAVRSGAAVYRTLKDAYAANAAQTEIIALALTP